MPVFCHNYCYNYPALLYWAKQLVKDNFPNILSRLDSLTGTEKALRWKYTKEKYMLKFLANPTLPRFSFWKTEIFVNLLEKECAIFLLIVKEDDILMVIQQKM